MSQSARPPTFFASEALKSSSRYVLERTKEVIENFGPRPPGSEGEGRLQESVREELSHYCDGEVDLEPFQVAQKAFMSMPWVSSTLLILSFLSYWISPLIALALSGLGVATVYWVLIRYRLFLDPFFPKQTSYNVLGFQKPTGEVKRRIILNSHPDAAYEWRFNYLCPEQFPFLLLYSLFALVAKFVIDLVIVILPLLFGEMETVVGWMFILQFVFLPGAVVGLFYTHFSVVSPGANDNLSGVFISLAIAKDFHEKNCRLENTEIGYLITGSEEAGLRGAKAFIDAHGDEYRDVETVFVALDTFRDLDHLSVYNKDMNGTVEHDPAVCRLLQTAGKDAGMDLPFATVTVGSTDGAAFTQGNHRAAALCAMDPHPADFYHTRRDHWSNMDEECIRKTIEILGAAIALYDRQGLEPSDR